MRTNAADTRTIVSILRKPQRTWTYRDRFLSAVWNTALVLVAMGAVAGCSQEEDFAVTAADVELESKVEDFTAAISNDMTPKEVWDYVNRRPELGILIPTANYMGNSDDFSRTFFEHFDRAGAWFEDTTDVYHSKVENGRYVFEHFIDDSMQFMWVPRAASANGNWGWETNIDHIQSSETASFGIVFGAKDSETASCFMINVHQKHFTIADKVNNQTTFFAEELRSSAVKSDSNTLRVESLNGKLLFSLNSQYLGSLPFQGRRGDKFGVVISGKARIEVDQIKMQW